jgi:hypothetical protein
MGTKEAIQELKEGIKERLCKTEKNREASWSYCAAVKT